MDIKKEVLYQLMIRKNQMEASLQFAHSKVKSLGDSGNSTVVNQIAEFEKMRLDCKKEIFKIDACLEWINKIINEN